MALLKYDREWQEYVVTFKDGEYFTSCKKDALGVFELNKGEEEVTIHRSAQRVCKCIDCQEERKGG